MTYDNPPIITSTMRRYNPQTGHYESVVTDPWAGAPKGIRVISSITGNRYVMLSNSFVYKPQGVGTWTHGGDTDVAGDVAWHASIGSEFPDFDGAPEGQRFYVSWGEGDLQSAVDTGDGVHVLIRGEWWKQDGVYGLKWYSKNFADVILVDPAPEEPKVVVHHTAKVGAPIDNIVASALARNARDWDDISDHMVATTSYSFTMPQYEPKPGDVIRDKSNHLETYYFTGKHWDKITRCGRVEAEDFTPPKRMEIVSRAVN